jgi:AcrR family transcriptional regulator
MGKNTLFRIQKKAIELFNKKGYHNTTISDICRAANVTKSTLYYHFKNKEQLITHLYSNVSELPSKAMYQLVSSENSWEIIWTILEQAISWTEQAGPLILSQIIIRDLQNKTDTLGLPRNSELEKTYVNIIQRGQQKGHFKNQSKPSILYQIMTNIVAGITVNWCLQNGAFLFKDMVKKRVIILLDVRTDLLKF